MIDSAEVSPKAPAVEKVINPQNPWKKAEGLSVNLADQQVLLKNAGTDKEEVYVRDKSNPLEDVRNRLLQLADPASGGATEKGTIGKSEPRVDEPKTEDKDSQVQKEIISKNYGQDQYWIDHNNQRRKVVAKALSEGKIDQRKHDKFISHIDNEQANPDRILSFNTPVFEGFNLHEQEEVKAVLKMLPSELLVHVKKIRVMPDDEFGAMRYYPRMRYKEGIVEIKKETFGYEKDTFVRKVLHEVGGHAMHDMTQALDPDLHKQMIDLWRKCLADNPGLILKDSYPRDILNGTLYKDHLRYRTSLKASEDEFWADRMAEYWYAKAAKETGSDATVYSNRDSDNPFTQTEEQVVKQVCRQTEEIWRQVLVKKNLVLQSQP